MLPSRGSHSHLGTVVGDRLDLGTGEDFDAQLLELPLNLLGHLGVLVGQRARQELHDGHVDPVVAQHVAELHADRSATGDDDRLRQLAGQDQFLVGDHVGRQRGARNQPGAAAGGDDGVVERDRLGPAVVEFDRDGVRVGEPAVAVDLGDLVLLHQEVHARDAALCHLAAAVEGDAVVEGRLSADAKGLSLFGEDVREFGVAQQRLDGMQPTLRQTPPQYFGSTTAVERPSCAARMAATYPPGPAPRTTTS